MQLLSEYDGSTAKTVKRTAKFYIDANRTPTVDFYFGGILTESRQYHGFTKDGIGEIARQFELGNLNLTDLV